MDSYKIKCPFNYVRYNYHILDQNDQHVYTATRSHASLGRAYTITDNNNQTVGSIKQKFLQLLPKYQITCHHNKLLVNKIFSWFPNKYAIIPEDGDMIHYLDGDFNGHGKTLATWRSDTITIFNKNLTLPLLLSQIAILSINEPC